VVKALSSPRKSQDKGFIPTAKEIAAYTAPPQVALSTQPYTSGSPTARPSTSHDTGYPSYNIPFAGPFAGTHFDHQGSPESSTAAIHSQVTDWTGPEYDQNMGFTIYDFDAIDPAQHYY
jgi:hypothetical protein